MTMRARTYGPPRPVEHRRRRRGRAWGNKYVGKAAILRQFIPGVRSDPPRGLPLSVTAMMMTKDVFTVIRVQNLSSFDTFGEVEITHPEASFICQSDDESNR